MKLRNSFFYTFKENAKDEDSVSGGLLVKAGFIKKNSNGIYMIMPLGLKTLKNIENIIRDEMNKAGALELSMPFLIPTEVFEQSNRKDAFGKSMFQLEDRYSREYCLGPTHEELFVEAAKMKIKSYKDMPFNLYQIGTKFRDELRPRLGLIRVREFLMKDAYSFDKDLDGLDKSYNIMFNTYKNIFDRLKINYRIVTASTGAMGGLLSEEFQAISDTGEDILVLCDNCNYSTNIEVGEFKEIEKDNSKHLNKELVLTEGHGTIEEISEFLNMDSSRFVKTLIYNINGEIVACLLPGNRDVNENKLSKLFNTDNIELADEEIVKKVTNAEIGFAGPIGLNIKIVIDKNVLNMSNFVVGANKTDYHYINVNIEDFKYDIVSDITNVLDGDLCPKCGNKLSFKKGIEVGNTFKLGTKYSESLNLQYLDETNKLNYVQMGCYGIGIERIMASIVEQNHDDYGIIWPYDVAPYKVSIIIVDTKDVEQMKYANDLYEKLNNLGIDCILDDRDYRVGVKFNDMDLIGIPYKIVVGKKLKEGLIEIKSRNNKDFELLESSNVIEYLKSKDI